MICHCYGGAGWYGGGLQLPFSGCGWEAVDLSHPKIPEPFLPVPQYLPTNLSGHSHCHLCRPETALHTPSLRQWTFSHGSITWSQRLPVYPTIIASELSSYVVREDLTLDYNTV